MSADTKYRWVPTGMFRTNGRPVFRREKIKETTPEENMPPSFFPEELKNTSQEPPHRIFEASVEFTHAGFIHRALEKNEN